MSRNSAIYFTEEAFTTSKTRLLGRHSAGEGFLEAFARYADIERLYLFAAEEGGETGFAQIAANLGLDTKSRPTSIIRQIPDPALVQAGALMLPGPGLHSYAWRRRRAEQSAFSLCGVTHTTASKLTMEAIGQLLLAPTQEWDALICTSTVVRDTVDRELNHLKQYFGDRFGARNFPTPQLPIIPLGVNTDRLAPDDAVNRDARKMWRERLEIADDDVAVLYVGRLSSFGKAHPNAMYIALEEAAQTVDRKVHLIQAGWFANKAIGDSYREAAQALAPSVTARFLDGREPDVRFSIWFAADIFCSLSDNIQETFGLTPIEAMAAGLPVVVSDWNGYRDTVPNEVAGYRVPTMAPPSGALGELAWRHEDEVDDYDRYCAHTCLATTVDINAAREAFITLINTPERRRAMGTAARRHTVAYYDWRVVIATYQDLWQELGDRREMAVENAPRKAGPSNPWQADPFDLFESYPTRQYDRDLRLVRDTARTSGYIGTASRLLINSAAQAIVGPNLRAQQVFDRIKEAPAGVSIGKILDEAGPEQRFPTWLAIGWLLKMGFVKPDGDPLSVQ